MKRVQITENQYNKFLIKYKENATAQEISNMRHNVADLKQNKLKVIARGYIAQAFKLGCEFENELDMAKKKEIMRRLNELQAKIDNVK